MIELFSLEFWIAVGFIINFLLVILLMILSSRLNRITYRIKSLESTIRASGPNADTAGTSMAAKDILDNLEPLVVESQKTAVRFDEQIREKKRLVRELNDALDTRIININLLLSRADRLQRTINSKKETLEGYAAFPAFSEQARLEADTIIDQQNRIIELFNQGSDTDTIAAKLCLPKGEVQLVIDLKKKFLAMETGR